MKAGPTGTEKVVYGLYALFSDDVKECVTEFEQASAMRPALPALDSAGKAYIASLAATDKLVAEAYTYYDRENYKDDQFAKGKALNGPLAASFESFVQAPAPSSPKPWMPKTTTCSAHHLVHIQKTQGRKLPYYQIALMAKAKQLADVLGDETFDAAAAAPRLEARANA